jgi:hypothetical protein
MAAEVAVAITEMVLQADLVGVGQARLLAKVELVELSAQLFLGHQGM